jgi:hypothetical protein
MTKILSATLMENPDALPASGQLCYKSLFGNTLTGFMAGQFSHDHNSSTHGLLTVIFKDL